MSHRAPRQPRRSRRHAGPILSIFAEVATPIFASRLTATRCINATRITCEVMAAFGLPARPVSVMAIAMNRRYREFLEQLGRLPEKHELDQWVADGAWALGTDTRAEQSDSAKNQWAGHLVALAGKPGDFTLVDAASGQMSRPEKAMALPEVFVGPVREPSFLLGDRTTIFESNEGAFLSYQARPRDTTWQQAAGWQFHPSNRRIAQLLVDTIAVRVGKRPSLGLTARPA